MGWYLSDMFPYGKLATRREKTQKKNRSLFYVDRSLRIHEGVFLCCLCLKIWSRSKPWNPCHIVINSGLMYILTCALAHTFTNIIKHSEFVYKSLQGKWFSAGLLKPLLMAVVQSAGGNLDWFCDCCLFCFISLSRMCNRIIIYFFIVSHSFYQVFLCNHFNF